jgi:hypothetical protein
MSCMLQLPQDQPWSSVQAVHSSSSSDAAARFVLCAVCQQGCLHRCFVQSIAHQHC